jgi:hypothetical protein
MRQQRLSFVPSLGMTSYPLPGKVRYCWAEYAPLPSGEPGSLSCCFRSRAIEFLAHPLLERDHVLRSS